MFLPLHWDLAKDLIGRLERAMTVFLKQRDLRLETGQKFDEVRFSSSRYDWVDLDTKSDVYYLILKFKALWETDNDFVALVYKPIAAGQWSTGTMTFSLTDGPEFFAFYLHDSFSFSVIMVNERFEEFKDEYEQIRLRREEKESATGRP